MFMTVEITVVIPTRNRKALLMRTLHSVLAQQDVDLAVLVVDDGGSDGTESALAGMDTRLAVIRHATSRGVSAARNSGIERATSRWLAFVDDDDLWAPLKLRSQLDALAANPAAEWSCTGSVNIDSQCQVRAWARPPAQADVGDLLLRQNAIPGGGSGVVASRELTTAIGGFDQALSNLADWDFYIRLGLRSELASVDRPYLGYYIHPQGMAHDVPRSIREARYLAVKYDAERRRRNVIPNDEGWLLYLAGMSYRGRRRWTGMRMHSELVLRHQRWRSVRSIALGLVPERVLLARMHRPGDNPLPDGWAEDTDSWFAPYVKGWLD
jgi:glycosyltransferase involved in cell wall biosynthesis